MIDAKEVGVGNPAEETFYHPNARIIAEAPEAVKPCFYGFLWLAGGTLTCGFAVRDCAAYG